MVWKEFQSRDVRGGGRRKKKEKRKKEYSRVD